MRHHRAPARPRQARADAGAGGGRDAPADREGQRCGIVFGPERNGLETDEVANADAMVMAPVNPSFASLNLAQAVLLVGYEWMKQAAMAARWAASPPTRTPIAAGPAHARLAAGEPKEELIGLFEHIERELERRGFFNGARKAPQRGAKYAHDVLADGCDGAGNPHPAGNC